MRAYEIIFIDVSFCATLYTVKSFWRKKPTSFIETLRITI